MNQIHHLPREFELRIRTWYLQAQNLCPLRLCNKKMEPRNVPHSEMCSWSIHSSTSRCNRRTSIRNNETKITVQRNVFQTINSRLERQIFTSCWAKSIKFCRSGSSRYVCMILSVKFSSSIDCIECGKTKPIIAIPISSRKNTSRDREY